MFHFVLCSVFAVFFDIFLKALSSKYWQCIQCEFWRDLPDCFSGLLHVAFPSRQPLSNMSWLSMSVMHLRARQTITHTTRMTSSHYDCGIRLITKIFRASAFAASSDFSRASFSASLIGQFGGFLALAHNFIRHYQQKTPQFHGSWGNEVSQSRIHPTKSII